MGNNLFIGGIMANFIGIPVEYLFTALGGLGGYAVISGKKTLEKNIEEHKKLTKEELGKLEKKIEKIETGEFVEKIVKNVIYSPESRSYFKSIFSEALEHKGKNNDSINLQILDTLEQIEQKINEKK